MNIVVCARSFHEINKKDTRNSFAEVLSWLARQKQDQRIWIISDHLFQGLFSFLPNVEIIHPGLWGKNRLLNKYWWEITLPGVLKKIKADVLISFDRQCSMSLSLPQVLVAFEGEKINPRSFKVAKLIITNSQWLKNELIKKHHIAKEKIEIVPISVNEMYKPAGAGEREKSKEKYGNDKEYFLCPEMQLSDEAFISLLKSFSHFKKRQQSNMKLLIAAIPSEKSVKDLSTYKYRDDVLVIEKTNNQDPAALINLAYAVVIPAIDCNTVFNVLKATQSNVPVITLEDAFVSEIAGDSALYVEKELGKDLGEKMIQIYTNEELRNTLIKKEKIIARNYSTKNSANLLWDCILKAIS